MSAPVISPITSVLAPWVGEQWNFKPAASNAPTSWREVIPGFEFTADATEDTIAPTGITLRNGQRLRLTSSGTLPAPLVAGEYYYVLPSNKLTPTKGGEAIDLTDTGTGTHSLSPTALPPGLELDPASGLISGVPAEIGVFNIVLIAGNGDGDSPEFSFPIGVRDPRAFLDSAIALQFDWDSGLVSLIDRAPSVDPAKPLLAFKNGDQLVLALQFAKGTLPFKPVVQNLVAAIRAEDGEPQVVLSSGSFGVLGSGPDSRFLFVLDTTQLPVGGAPVVNAIEEQARDGLDVVHAWLEIRVGYNYDPLQSGEPSTFYRASRSMPVDIYRSLAA